MHIETINITLGGGQSAIVRAFLEALVRMPEAPEPSEPATPAPAAQTTTPATPPKVGEQWPEQGGIYCGIARGFDGEPDGHMVLLPDLPAAELNWVDAKAWAEGLGNGARLPARFESALLYANVRDKTDTAGYYWTDTQYSGSHAFSQYFNYGNQLDYVKKFEARARAVRRLAI